MIYLDPCLDIDIVQYNRSGGCRSYYACEYGISIPQCCDKGFRFNGRRCIPDATCYDPCSTPFDIEQQMRYQRKYILRIVVLSNQYKYYLHVLSKFIFIRINLESSRKSVDSVMYWVVYSQYTQYSWHVINHTEDTFLIFVLINLLWSIYPCFFCHFRLEGNSFEWC